MKTSVVKKRLIASVITALLAVSACSITVFAAEQPEESNGLQQVTVESVESSEGGLTTEPEYLNPLLRGAAIPHKVMDLSSSVETYHIAGQLIGKRDLYTEYMFIGKYTYNITLNLNTNAGTSISYYVINASSNNEIKKSGVIRAGQTVNISVPGFSKTSKMYIKFSGSSNDSAKPSIITGFIS